MKTTNWASYAEGWITKEASNPDVRVFWTRYAGSARTYVMLNVNGSMPEEFTGWQDTDDPEVAAENLYQAWQAARAAKKREVAA